MWWVEGERSARLGVILAYRREGPSMGAASDRAAAYGAPREVPVLVESYEADTTDFSWPDDDIRGITAPTMIILGDSDGVTLEQRPVLPSPRWRSW